MSELDFAKLNERLESETPRTRLEVSLEIFGDELLFTSSFGAGSGVLLHLWSEVAPGRPVIFIDTGFLFAETHAYKDDLAERFGLTIETVRPAVAREQFLADYGHDISATNPDFCCAQNKVEPLQPRLRAARAWVSGLRRDQGRTRVDTPILLVQEGGPVKVYPIASMTSAEIHEYLERNGIPEHPLAARGYRSIGCAPCTRAVGPGEDERAGRWAWTSKTECGLHTIRTKAS
jgi:phosphoadenosine phosphosulfate reductase